MKRRNLKNWVLALATATAISGCMLMPMEMREDVADRIARPAFMSERVIAAGPFNLTAWEKMHKHFAPATVYIEGDGLAWVSRSQPSLNPTPKNPVALHLAAMDKDDNVAYLARPCQFTGWNGEGACPAKYWTSDRFAPEVIAAYQDALDNIKAMYDIKGFNLVGYSGGAAIAALVAAERKDVLSLRTVAGNLDSKAWTDLQQISPLEGSLNPADVAPQLAGLPQRHFIGGNDPVMPPAIFQSWNQASGPTDCVKSTIIPENDHERGWVEKWPDLLKEPIDCQGPPKPAPAPIPQSFIDARKPKGK